MRFVRRGPVCHLLAFPFFQCLSFFNFSAVLRCGQASRCCAKLLTIYFLEHWKQFARPCDVSVCVCLCWSSLPKNKNWYLGLWEWSIRSPRQPRHCAQKHATQSSSIPFAASSAKDIFSIWALEEGGFHFIQPFLCSSSVFPGKSSFRHSGP